MHFYSQKSIRKFRLENGGHFVSALMSLGVNLRICFCPEVDCCRSRRQRGQQWRRHTTSSSGSGWKHTAHGGTDQRCVGKQLLGLKHVCNKDTNTVVYFTKEFHRNSITSSLKFGVGLAKLELTSFVKYPTGCLSLSLSHTHLVILGFASVASLHGPRTIFITRAISCP